MNTDDAYLHSLDHTITHLRAVMDKLMNVFLADMLVDRGETPTAVLAIVQDEVRESLALLGDLQREVSAEAEARRDALDAEAKALPERYREGPVLVYSDAKPYP